MPALRTSSLPSVPDPMPPAAPLKPRGRFVVLGLVGLCLLACLGTMWRYSLLHTSTNNAAVEVIDGQSLIVANFARTEAVAPGQRAVISSATDSSFRLTGVVLKILPDRRIAITPEKEIPAGTRLAVTLETPAP